MRVFSCLLLLSCVGSLGTRPDVVHITGDPFVSAESAETEKCLKEGWNVCRLYMTVNGHHISSLGMQLQVSERGALNVDLQEPFHPGDDSSCLTFLHGDKMELYRQLSSIKMRSDQKATASWYFEESKGHAEREWVMQVAFKGSEKVSGTIWLYSPAMLHWESSFECLPSDKTLPPAATLSPASLIRQHQKQRIKEGRKEIEKRKESILKPTKFRWKVATTVEKTTSAPAEAKETEAEDFPDDETFDEKELGSESEPIASYRTWMLVGLGGIMLTLLLIVLCGSNGGTLKKIE